MWMEEHQNGTASPPDQLSYSSSAFATCETGSDPHGASTHSVSCGSDGSFTGVNVESPFKGEHRRWCAVRSRGECCRRQSHAEREVPQGENRWKGGDPRTEQTWKGTTRTPGWQPEETEAQLPLVSEKTYSQTSVSCVRGQREGSPKTPLCEGERTQGP